MGTNKTNRHYRVYGFSILDPGQKALFPWPHEEGNTLAARIRASKAISKEQTKFNKKFKWEFLDEGIFVHRIY